MTDWGRRATACLSGGVRAPGLVQTYCCPFTFTFTCTLTPLDSLGPTHLCVFFLLLHSSIYHIIIPSSLTPIKIDVSHSPIGPSAA